MQSHPNSDFSSVSSLMYLEQKYNEFKIKGYKLYSACSEVTSIYYLLQI